MNAGSLLRAAAGVPIRRIALSCIAAFFAAIALIAGCIWIESRYVLAPSQSPTIEKVRGAVTQPVAAAVGRQIQKMWSRREAWMRIVAGDSTIQENIAGLLDESLTWQKRQIFAQRLAQIDTPEAFAALLRAFQKASPEQKPFFAQLIGSTGNPMFKEPLLALLADPDEKLVNAAIEGLAAIGGKDVTAKLAAVLDDANRPEKIRVTAAAGLADIGTSEACDAVIRAFPTFAQTDAAADLLTSLGHFPFPEIDATFRDFLAAPETPPEMRVEAVEALADSSSEAVPFLLEVVKNDADPNVRASAAWAISAHGLSGTGPELTELAMSESNASVRRRLYEALTVQANPRGAELLPRVLAESDIAARIAGFNALAVASALDPDSQVANTFDQQIVPELQRIATSQNTVNLGMRAVFALRRSGSAPAQQALAAISVSEALPQVVAAARSGLLSSTH